MVKKKAALGAWLEVRGCSQVRRRWASSQITGLVSYSSII